MHPVASPVKAFYDTLRSEMSLTLVDKVNPSPGENKAATIKRLRALEGIWENKLQTLHPYGLNVRDEGKFAGSSN